MKIHSERTRDGNTKVVERYYITGSSLGAKDLLQAVRSHWGIENKLHRTLDVLFLEDAAQEHDRTTAANLLVIQKLAVSMLSSLVPKENLVSKRKRAAYDLEFRKALLREKI